MELPTRDRVHPLAQYLLALAGTIGAYAGYNAFVAPRIEGTPPVPRDATHVQRTLATDDDSVEWLRPWLPADAWELGKCKSLRTEDTLLLFQDYVTRDDGTVQIYPLTIVLGAARRPAAPLQNRQENGSDPAGFAPPVIVRATEQAELVFDRPLQLGGDGPGRLMQGRLPGRVEVFQPGAGGTGGTRIVTSNLQLTPLRIFTLEQVEFAHEGSRGSGRNLVLDLAHAAPPGAINAGFANVTGLARMELAFLDFLELTTGDPEAPSVPSSQIQSNRRDLRLRDSTNAVGRAVRETSAVVIPAAAPPPPAPPHPAVPGRPEPLVGRGEEILSGADGSTSSLESVRIHCRGPLVFDFNQQTATFRDQVTVQATDQSGDELQGDLLQVVFRREPDSGEIAGGNTAGRSLARLKPDVVIAEGRPARLVLPSRSASAAAERLEYHLGLSQLRASDSTAVIVRQAGQEFVARSLEYRIREDRTLGPLVAQGPGQLMARSSANDGPALNEGQLPAGPGWRVTFGEQLTIQPDGDRRLVTLSGGAVMEPEPGQRISGDRVQLWLEPGTSAALQPAGTERPLSADYQPVRAEVTGNVEVQLDRLHGTTSRLVAEWGEGESPAVGMISPSGRKISQSVGAADKKRPGFEPDFTLTHETSFGRSPSASAPHPPPPSPRRRGEGEDDFREGGHGSLQFKCDEIRVRLERGEGASAAREVELAGQVLVRQRKAQPDVGAESGADLEVTGDWLQLVPAGENLWRAHVTGTAGIVTPEMTLSGQDLQMDQAANRAWVTGPGELSMLRRGDKAPALSIASTGEGTADLRGRQSGAVPHGPESLQVTWQGGMIFDGGRVWFEQQVRSAVSRSRSAESGSEEIRTVSEALTLTFDRPISFEQPTGGLADQANGPQVRKLSLAGRLAPGQQAFPVAARTDSGETGTSVVLERTMRDGAKNVTGREVMIVPAVDADLDSGDIQAGGPGALIHWRPGGEGESRGLFGSAAPAQGQVKAEGQPGVTCLHLNFDGQLTANSKRTEMQIDGQVRGVFGPVKAWDEQLNPAQAPPPAGCTRLTCQSVSLVQWTPEAAGSPMTELIATGDAVILGEAFEARGRRVSYNQQNDLLVLEGDGRTDANLWHATRPGAPRNQLVAGKILYRPGDGWTQIEKVRSATINQQGR